MNGVQVGVALALVSTALLPRAEGADIGQPGLVVRAYLATPVRDADWSAATRETAAILGDAGVGVDWMTCSGGTDVPERCATPMKWNEVAVRIVRVEGAHELTSKAPLGESLLDPSHRLGTLATIYLDRVEWLARASRVSVAILLARAIAHELGHLLLGTPTHSGGGLMRAMWTRDELARRVPADWVFPADDAVRLRLAFERRTAGQPAMVATWALSPR
jgi:hypothetical protein